MKIPAYWSRATVEDVNREGRTVSFSCWRWSDTSKEDARQSALAAAQRILQKSLRGDRLDRYGYGQVPLREEMIEKFDDPQGELFAAVTRNAYGSLVLNTSRALFIDIDFPPVSPGQRMKHFFGRLFGGTQTPAPEAQREIDARRRLEQFQHENPHWTFRVYRTFAGLRALATHDLFDPASGFVWETLQALGSDPLYVRLCKAQECFRARLTPKPWRCGHAANHTGWPRETADQERRFEHWQARYAACQGEYATCRFLEELGHAPAHPVVGPIIELHDAMTRCHEPLKLA